MIPSHPSNYAIHVFDRRRDQESEDCSTKGLRHIAEISLVDRTDRVIFVLLTWRSALQKLLVLRLSVRVRTRLECLETFSESLLRGGRRVVDIVRYIRLRKRGEGTCRYQF